MAEKVEVSQEDIAFVRSLEDCPDKPLHESMFVPFFASKIGEYRASAFEAGRQQGLREAAEAVRAAITRGYETPAIKGDKCAHDRFGWEDCICCYDDALEAAITALMEGEGKQ